MTIFVAANTAAGFDYFQNPVANNNAAYRDSTNGVTTSLMLKSSSGFIQRDLQTALTEGWLHASLYFPSPVDPNIRRTFLLLYDTSGQAIFEMQRYANNMETNVYTGVSTKVAGSSGSVSSATRFSLDINFKIHPTAGFYKVYANNILIASYTGKTDYFPTGVASVRWADFNIYSDAAISEFIVADEDTRGMKVKTMFGNAAGTTSGFTGAYTDVSGSVLPQETTGITTDTADVVSTFNLAAAPAASTAIRGVFVNIRASKGSTGPQSINGVVRTGGVDYHSADKLLEGIVKSRTFGWAVNPGTGLPWALADLGPLEAGVRSRA